VLIIEQEQIDASNERRVFKKDLIEDLYQLYVDDVELLFMRLKKHNKTYQWHLSVRYCGETFVLRAEYPETQGCFGIRTLKNLAARVLIWRDTHGS